ncbi:PAS domain-containing protein [Kiloniella laminariae]|uniref:PAS domain-containing protein n=1 Tax=Kiloniella laminariae TaxID=454162 RepID=A0ABT4LQ78_9PROT|nr:PAS domain-containing protein [Kiloniella laminariae]MCZ4283050.1 PAS domain-containing protein [Kiloniella laminariae]
MHSQVLTGKERFFKDDEIIVSKTDLKGHITYANKIFLKIADYKETEVLGQPHRIIRHPSMPRAIFRLLWETLEKKQEIFAYVINRTKGGDHYWVIAHVTPSLDSNNRIIGYHSNRRVPERKVLDQTIIPLYKNLWNIEQQDNRKTGLQQSYKTLTDLLHHKGQEYDEYISRIINNRGEAA